MNLSDADFATLKVWVNDPDQQPVSITLPRLHLFALASTLQMAVRRPELPETTRTVINSLLASLHGLMPDDIRDLAANGPIVCECGRPLIGLKSHAQGRCEVCLDDSRKSVAQLDWDDRHGRQSPGRKAARP